MIFSLYSGEVALLRRTEEGIFQSCLAWVRGADSERGILETLPDAQGWRLRSLEQEQVEEDFTESWSLVSVPQASELFDKEEATPAEFAVILSKLHQAGVRDLAFTNELTWGEVPEIELLAFDGALRPFREALLPLSFTEVPEPSPHPDWLKDSVIPRESLVGDISSLPLMNQVVKASSVAGNEKVKFAFPDFGGRDARFRAPGRLPLLVRWGDDFMASWPLQIAMRVEGVSAAEVEIEAGRHLRLGADGPVIPIDDYGRAKVGEISAGAEGLEFISAKTLFPLEEVDLPSLKEQAVLVDVRDNRAEVRSLTLLQEARALLSLPRPGAVEEFKRLSLGWEAFLYLEIVLVAIFALYVRAFPQLIALAVLCAGLFCFAIGLLQWKGLWTPLLPLIVSIVVAWCLVGYLQQIAHPIKKRAKKRKKTPAV